MRFQAQHLLVAWTNVGSSRRVELDAGSESKMPQNGMVGMPVGGRLGTSLTSGCAAPDYKAGAVPATRHPRSVLEKGGGERVTSGAYC